MHRCSFFLLLVVESLFEGPLSGARTRKSLHAWQHYYYLVYSIHQYTCLVYTYAWAFILHFLQNLKKLSISLPSFW